MIRRWIKKQFRKFFSRFSPRAIQVKSVTRALRYRLEFEKLIAVISAHFISITVDKIDEGIHESFENICKFAKVDRGYIFWYSDILGRHMEKIQEWCGNGISSELPRIREINMGMLPYFDLKIKSLEPFFTHKIQALPQEAALEKQEFIRQQVKSFVFVPMIYEGKAIGFMGFEMLRKEVVWHQETIPLLKLTSEIFVNALERTRADKTLRQSEERYALIAHGVNDGLWDWNLKTNKIFYSPRWKSMLGFSAEAVSEEPSEWMSRIHPDDKARVEEKLQDHLEGRTAHLEIEHRIFHYDGTYRWVLARGVAVRDSKNRVLRMAGSLTDITTRIRYEEKLKHKSLHDSLTGLPNRTLFLNHLKSSLNQASSDLFAVLFIDLDRFKTINDTFGHLFGDEVLVAVSRAIQKCLDKDHMVARFGGDEFTLLLTRLQSDDHAIRIAQYIQTRLSLPFEIQGQMIQLSASIGIALSSAKDIKSESDLLRNADMAMYRAKSICKGRHVIYTEAMHKEVRESLQLETELRRALELNQLRIHYQPIISIPTNTLVGFEALIRWYHPERGIIPPNVFIPLAEEAGIVIPLGNWVLKEACREAIKWPRQGVKPLSVSVNLSVKQFMDPHLVETIRAELQETGMSPESLHLEITESVLIQDQDHAIEILKQLRLLGVKLYLDDFGTGYSSLSYLHQFPMDVLKIDRSFVHRIHSDEIENSAIAKTIISLAHNMNMEVVAEGVETEAQMRFLEAHGCEYAQGYFYAKPLTAEATAEFVCAG